MGPIVASDFGAPELEKEPSIVAMTDIEFENSLARINFLKDYPETRIADKVLGPYRMGQEVELPLWIARHLVEMGYAKFREDDQLTLKALSTTHYTETLPSARTIPKLSRSFYFRVRRLLKELRRQEAKDRSKGRDFDKALALARDIANIRIKKIASLGASSDQTTEQASNLTAEERALYDRIKQMIDEWKRDILGIEAAE